MKDLAALLNAIASLIGAVVWPALIVAAYFAFRAQLHVVASGLPRLVNRMSKISALGIEAELSAQGEAAARKPLEETAPVSAEQVQAAVRIAAKAEDVPLREVRKTVRGLAEEYEAVRRGLPSGPDRTTELNRVLAKMRGLSLAAQPLVDELKESALAGARLMAIAIMQVSPALRHLPWLVERFGKEHPFVFFHAAVAMQTLLTATNDEADQARIEDAARASLAIVRGFAHGEPDPNTVNILESVITLSKNM